MYESMKVFNRRESKEFRQKNRSQGTEPEQKLWYHLRRNTLGVKFRRQHGIGSYIVDFYCPDKSLVVEVDGDSHYQPGARIYDNKRDQYLRSQGLTVLRFTNPEVTQNIEGVVGMIHDEIQRLGHGNPP